MAGRTAGPDGSPITQTAEHVAGMGFSEMSPERLAWINGQWSRAGKWTLKGAIACTLYDVVEKLPLVKCPTLVVYGSRDIVREGERELVAGIKGARSIIIENAGHLPHIDQPDVFIRSISDFLSAG